MHWSVKLHDTLKAECWGTVQGLCGPKSGQVCAPEEPFLGGTPIQPLNSRVALDL